MSNSQSKLSSIIFLTWKFRLDTPSQHGATPENMIKFYDIMRTMEGERRYDIFNTWEINKSSNSRDEGKIDEDNIYLSDIEEIENTISFEGE